MGNDSTTASPPAPSSESGRALAGLLGRDAVYTGVWALQIVAAALVTPFATRLMSREQFGLLAGANAVMQVLFVIAGAGLATALQQREAQGQHREARVLLTATITASVVITGICAATVSWWARPLGLAHESPLLLLSVLWAGTSAVTNAGLAVLRSRDHLAGFVVVSLAQSVVAEVLSLVLVASVPGPAAHLFVIGQFVAQVAATVLVLALVPPAPLGLRQSPLVAAALRFAVPLVPAALATFVLASADRLLLQGLVGAEAVGGYQLAYNIATVPGLLLASLNQSWLSRLFALGQARDEVLAASRDIVFRLLPSVLVGMAFGGPVLLRLWAPASYRPDTLVPVVVVVALAVVPEAGAAAAGRTLLVAGRSAGTAVATLVAAVLNVVLNLALDPWWGVVGAAVATTVSFVALWTIQSRLASRHVSLHPTPRPVRVAVAVAALAALASIAVPVGGGFLAVRLAVAIAALAALAWTVSSLRNRALAGAGGRDR